VALVTLAGCQHPGMASRTARANAAGRVRDPLGNIWWIQAHVEGVDPAELAQRREDPSAAEALRYVESSLDAAMRERPQASH